MLSFNSTLVNKLKLRNAQAFWCLKLYYNDESAFVGVSDTHRVDGSDIYYGLVTDWGSMNQSLAFFEFKTNISYLSIKLVNSKNSFQNGNFSDQLATKNFANRKWELFQCVHGLTFDTAANKIGTGIISGNITYNRNEVTLTLLDNTSRFHKEIPVNKVTSAVFPNAPEKNINKPLPMSYGDFDVDSNAPTSGARFDRHLTSGKFPAIVVDEWHKTDARVEARLDNSALHTLNANRVYTYDRSLYSACDSGGTSVDASAGAGEEQVSVKGNTWFAYVRLKSHATYDAGNYANEIDNDPSTAETLTVTAEDVVSEGWRIPKIPKLGDLVSVSLLLDIGSYTKPGGASDPTLHVSNNAGGTDIVASWDPNPDEQTINFTSLYSATQTQNWDLEGDLFLDLTGAAEVGTYSITINEVALELSYIPDSQKVHTKEIKYDVIFEETTLRDDSGMGNEEVVQRSRTKTKKVFSHQPLADYLYASGKGRKYGAWIDTIDGNTRTSENGTADDPGYGTSDFIANPIYIIEDILRTELGLDSGTDGSDIDVHSFDVAGNTTDGQVGEAFDDAVADVKFALSQDTLVDSKTLIENICSACCSWVWISGDGKFKVKSRRQPNDYTAEDFSIDYNDITLDMIQLTALNQIRNDIIVNYAYDYGQQQNLKQKTATDATSQGTTVGGFRETLSLDVDAYVIQDSTTAQQLATSYKNFHKDRWITIMFDVPSAKYNFLEIGDIINFDNWDSNIKLFGAAMDSSNNFFMITQMNKRPNGGEFFCTEVSD